MLYKLCTKCKESKALGDFRKQSSTKDGLKYCCKECDDEAAKKYYQKNKNKIITNVTEWQKNNPNKVRDYKRSYYQKAPKAQREDKSL